MGREIRDGKGDTGWEGRYGMGKEIRDGKGDTARFLPPFHSASVPSFLS